MQHGENADTEPEQRLGLGHHKLELVVHDDAGEKKEHADDFEELHGFPCVAAVGFMFSLIGWTPPCETYV